MFIRPATPARAMATMGQPPTARQQAALVDLARRTVLSRGPLKGRRMPDGFTPMVVSATTVAVAAAFQVSVTAGDTEGEYVATITPGTAGGIPAMIDGVALDDLDDDGDPPQLTISAGAWSPHGNIQRSLILLQYDLDHTDFSITAVTPMAVATPPDPAPWTWWKTLAWLVMTSDGTVTVRQRVYFDQAFDVAGAIAASGAFQPLPSVAA